MTREDLAKAIYEIAHLKGEFLLRSGKTSNEYFDKYRFESNPQILQAIADQMAPLIPEGTEILAGLEVGGIPIATALSLKTGIPVCFVRKEAKEYGTCKFAEGPDIKGKKLLIVEDVVTTGGQIKLSVADLRKEGAVIDTAVGVIDREQGGTEGLQSVDLEFRPLLTMTEIKKAAGVS